MNRKASVFAAQAVQRSYGLLVACGAALVLSIPPAVRVADLLNTPWRISPQLFFFVYVLVTALAGLSRGAVAAAEPPLRRNPMPFLALHAAFDQLLTVPLLVFARMLLPPGHGIALLLLAIYAFLVTLLTSFLAFRVDRAPAAPRARPFFVRYAAFIVLFLAPWLLGASAAIPDWVARLSPIGATASILRLGSAADLVVAFGFVGSVVAAQLAIAPLRRRRHGV